MYFTGDKVFETPAPRKNLSIVVFFTFLAYTILLGTKRCDKIAFRDFQLGLYNVLIIFRLLI